MHMGPWRKCRGTNDECYMEREVFRIRSQECVHMTVVPALDILVFYIKEILIRRINVWESQYIIGRKSKRIQIGRETIESVIIHGKMNHGYDGAFD